MVRIQHRNLKAVEVRVPLNDSPEPPPWKPGGNATVMADSGQAMDVHEVERTFAASEPPPPHRFLVEVHPSGSSGVLVFPEPRDGITNDLAVVPRRWFLWTVPRRGKDDETVVGHFPCESGQERFDAA